MEIKNFLEDIVKRVSHNLMEEEKDFCNCERCQADVVAYSLNHLKPKYAANVKGHALTAVDLESEQIQAEVTVQVLKAMKQVKKNPNH
jgi:competence protein ComFB